MTAKPARGIPADRLLSQIRATASPAIPAAITSISEVIQQGEAHPADDQPLVFARREDGPVAFVRRLRFEAGGVRLPALVGRGSAPAEDVAPARQEFAVRAIDQDQRPL